MIDLGIKINKKIISPCSTFCSVSVICSVSTICSVPANSILEIAQRSSLIQTDKNPHIYFGYVLNCSRGLTKFRLKYETFYLA